MLILNMNLVGDTNRELDDKENAAKAFTYFESSAVKGFALSQFVLGTYFDVGYGCEPDKDMAIWWYEQAAGTGLA